MCDTVNENETTGVRVFACISPLSPKVRMVSIPKVMLDNSHDTNGNQESLTSLQLEFMCTCKTLMNETYFMYLE